MQNVEDASSAKMELQDVEFAKEQQKTSLYSHEAGTYICEMLEELWQLAETAKLKDMAGLLKVTLTALEASARSKI